MRSVRRKLSLLLAVAMVMASCLNPGMTSRAEEGDSLPGLNIGTPIVDLTGLPDGGMENHESEVKNEAQDEVDNVQEATGSNAAEDFYQSQEPSVMSLLPVDEVEAYLFLSQMSDEELKAVKISYILSHLVRYSYSSNDRTPIEVDYTGKKIMVNLYSNSDPSSEEESTRYHLSDEYIEKTDDDTVDLSVIRRNLYTYYTLEIMVGSGEQLDYDAVRYRINVVLENEFYVDNSYTVYDDANKTAAIDAERIEEIKLNGVENVDIPATSVYYYIPKTSYSADKEYVFVPESEVNSSGNMIRSALYKMDDVLSYYRGEAKTLEAEKALSEVKGAFTQPEENAKVTSADLYCMVYFLSLDDGSESAIAYEGLQFIVAPSDASHKLPVGAIYSYKDGNMEKISRDNPYQNEGGLYANRWIRLSVEKNAMVLNHYSSISNVQYGIVSGHTDKEDYYYVLNSSLKDKVSKVVAGNYSTEEAAQKGEDITTQIFADENAAAPYGYKINFSDGNSRWRYFTLIYKDGTVYRYEVYLSNISSAAEYSDDPFVNSTDPWFRITGCAESYRTYRVENDRDRTLDTLYGYKYQTVFINDKDVDLSQIKPEFWTNSEAGYEVKVVNTKTQDVLKSGETVQDFSNGPVQYTVYVGDSHQRNYYVQFVKKESGPNLFVNYPSDLMEEGRTKRTIFLTGYFENRHDILIANTGDTDLTGLKVELSDDAQHVALDEYWTVNGDAHSTLQGFDDNIYWGTNGGELRNFAKVRLVPDGAGEISGTLTISATGQDPYEIELTGYASNPTIVTATLSNAVRYVPFSNVVATNNMLDDNIVTFSIEDGELPEGIELRPHSGEIYGVPKEVGDYTFTIKADYSRVEFVPSYTELKLTVLDNTNENVYGATDEGYELQEHIGQDMGNYDYYLAEPSDQLFVSTGVMDEFDHKVFLNGEELEEGVDYTAESGSTRITIKSQTFSSKAKRDGSVNTIAAEFRKKGSVGTVSAGKGTETTQEMKETSQNFRMSATSGGSSGSSSSGSSGGSTSTAKPAVVPDSNWTQDAAGWRHQLDDGSWATSSWQQLTYNGVTSWYYFGADGYMMTGWYTDADGRRYYLNPSSDGTQGAMAVGWRFIDGEWYYFNTAAEGTEGSLSNSGWHYLEYNGVKDWYYFDNRQIMASGWITVDGRRYYLNPVSDGFKGRMLTGWQQVDGRWYYFDEQSGGTQGAMMTDTTIGEYYVGRDGVWVQ